MTAISAVRHQSIFDPSQYNPPVHIIGAGATGSRVFMELVSLGLTNISLYDFDHVEPHNLANQIYDACDVGLPKVEACRGHAERKIGVADLPPTFRFIESRVGDGHWPNMQGVLFLLTDTMASRREIYDHYIGGPLASGDFPDLALMVETRMASSFGNVFTINTYNEPLCTEWADTLVDDDDESTEVSACGASISVGPTAAIIANYAVWQFITAMIDPKMVRPTIDLFCNPPMICNGE